MTKIDRRELIAGLNVDLANEYASVIQYRTFASAVRGRHRPTLRPLFAAEIGDELGHAELLADAIVSLGGEPTVTAAPVAVAEGAEAMLESVLAAEEGALARYLERRRQAEALGEVWLVVGLDDMIVDETRHRNELRLVLDGWSDAMPDRLAAGARAAAGRDEPRLQERGASAGRDAERPSRLQHA